jgi:hypothetical protein
MPRKKGVDIIEVVKDDDLKMKEEQATATFRRFFPHAPSVKLYRTADGRTGFQVSLTLGTGERKLLNDAYAAVMKVLGEKRGRPAGRRKVQAKLRLHEDVYKALKETADRSHKTLSSLVEDLAHQARLV